MARGIGEQFSLGAAGISDRFTGGTWAAEVYAAQEAERKGLSADQERQLRDKLKGYQSEHPEIVEKAVRAPLKKLEDAFGLGPLGWILSHIGTLVIVGGLGAGLYFAWPFLAAKWMARKRRA